MHIVSASAEKSNGLMRDIPSKYCQNNSSTTSRVITKVCTAAPHRNS